MTSASLRMPVFHSPYSMQSMVLGTIRDAYRVMPKPLTSRQARYRGITWSPVTMRIMIHTREMHSPVTQVRFLPSFLVNKLSRITARKPETMEHRPARPIRPRLPM